MNSRIKLDIKHSGVEVTARHLDSVKKLISDQPDPSFYTHNPDFKKIERVCRKYQKYKNIIVIANGGSRTSSLAYIGALASSSRKKDVVYCSTMDPSYIHQLKSQYKPSNTLIMPISKSGTNVDVLEPLSAFWDKYPVLAVTGEGSLLWEIAEAKKWDVLVHPEVGGRFSGRTSSAYGVAQLAGVDTKKIDEGARAAYKKYHYSAPGKRNDALKAAVVAYELERRGYTEIFTPIYSWEYSHFLPLMVQLVHESTGKKGIGQTIYGDMGPESQHHTNQRFFGGHKNVMGMFVTNKLSFDHKKSVTKVPRALRKLKLRDGKLGDLHRVPFGKGLQFDFEGTRDNAKEKNILFMTVQVEDVSPESVGYFLSFLHYFTVYSALLRGQDPFDQPEVEGAKAISFEKRRRYKR